MGIIKQRTMELFYHPVSPPARACELLAKLLKLDVKVTTLDLFNGDQMKPEFLAINPAHCVPTLKDGDLVLWESRAILQYMVNKYAPNSTFYPTDPVARAKIDFLLAGIWATYMLQSWLMNIPYSDFDQCQKTSVQLKLHSETSCNF